MFISIALFSSILFSSMACASIDPTLPPKKILETIHKNKAGVVSDIKLTSIVLGKNVTKKHVMIDGKRYKEGKMVKGFYIYAINQRSITVMDSEKKLYTVHIASSDQTCIKKL